MGDAFFRKNMSHFGAVVVTSSVKMQLFSNKINAKQD